MSETIDVFLSHNSKDKPALRELAKSLRGYGLCVWIDEDELQPGIPWQPLLEKAIMESKAGAVLVGNDGLGPWEDEEMQALLQFAVSRKIPVIPVLLPGAPARPELPIFLRNRTWVDLRNGFSTDEIGRLVWGITGKKSNSTLIETDKSGGRTTPGATPQTTVITPTGATPNLQANTGHPSTELPTDKPQPTSALDPFFKFAADYRSIILYILGYGSIPFLLDFIYAVGPPWPQSTGVAAFTTLTSWLVLLYSYAMWEGIKKANFQRLIGWMTPLAAFSLVVFIVFKAFFCMNAPDYRHQEAIGWELQQPIKMIYVEAEEKRKAAPTVAELFAGKEYQPYAIWKEWTVNTSRVVLLLSWLTMYATVSFVISIFVLMQHDAHSHSAPKLQPK